MKFKLYDRGRESKRELTDTILRTATRAITNERVIQELTQARPHIKLSRLLHLSAERSLAAGGVSEILDDRLCTAVNMELFVGVF